MPSMDELINALIGGQGTQNQPNQLGTMMGAKPTGLLGGAASPQSGLLSPYMNKGMAAQYARVYPWLAQDVYNPRQLMANIDGEAQRMSAQRGSADAYKFSVLLDALKEIHGINDYTPKGFQNSGIPVD